MPVPPNRAMFGWFRTVWNGGGGLGRPVIEEVGDKRSRVGCRRYVGYGIHEEIVAADIATEHSTVLRIVYTVQGTFPVRYSHHAPYIASISPLIPPCSLFINTTNAQHTLKSNILFYCIVL